MTQKNKPEVSANPTAVEWPRDEFHLTQGIKAAGLRAAGGVRGNKVKLRVLIAVLRVLEAHAIARYNKHVADEDNTAKDYADRVKREQALNAKRHASLVKLKEAELAALKGEEVPE